MIPKIKLYKLLVKDKLIGSQRQIIYVFIIKQIQQNQGKNAQGDAKNQ